MPPQPSIPGRPAHPLAYRGWLLAVILILLPLSGLGTASMQDFLLQHVLTVLTAVLLVVTRRRLPFSDTACTGLFIFTLLHLVGARYLYSFVPYDDWSDAVLGLRLGEQLGFERNHYDRVVHFCFGLLLYRPAAEFAQLIIRPRPGWPGALAVLIIAALSTVYELIEWGIAVVLAPEAAELYNGQQGDVWDPHKDSALALAGALLAWGLASGLGRWRGPSPDQT